VTLAIISKQPQPIIGVGDPYQAIYGFRDAENGCKLFVQHRRSA
jgi:ATP-dependent exoDNAse (exonuclease V) beta subunit